MLGVCCEKLENWAIIFLPSLTPRLASPHVVGVLNILVGNICIFVSIPNEKGCKKHGDGSAWEKER